MSEQGLEVLGTPSNAEDTAALTLGTPSPTRDTAKATTLRELVASVRYIKYDEGSSETDIKNAKKEVAIGIMDAIKNAKSVKEKGAKKTKVPTASEAAEAVSKEVIKAKTIANKRANAAARVLLASSAAIMTADNADTAATKQAETETATRGSVLRAVEIDTGELYQSSLDKLQLLAILTRVLLFSFAGTALGLAVVIIISTHGDSSHILLVVASFLTLVLSFVSLVPPIAEKLHKVGVTAADFILFALWLTSANTSAGSDTSDCAVTLTTDGNAAVTINSLPWCNKGKATATIQVVLVVLHYVVVVVQFVSVHLPTIQGELAKLRPPPTVTIEAKAKPLLQTDEFRAESLALGIQEFVAVLKQTVHRARPGRTFSAGLMFAKPQPEWDVV